MASSWGKSECSMDHDQPLKLTVNAISPLTTVKTVNLCHNAMILLRDVVNSDC